MNDQNSDLMTLKTQADEAPQGDPYARPAKEADFPLMGLFAVGFGLFAIFVFAPLFVPLTLILGLVALFRGQILLGLLSIVLAVIGILNSWILIGMFSLGALWAWIGF